MADLDPMFDQTTATHASFAAGNGVAPVAVITGGSSGIGLELARIAAREGYALVLAAESFPDDFRSQLGDGGRGDVRTVEADLSTSEGVAQLVAEVADRPVALLCANAGEGLGDGFLEQDFASVRRLIQTNVTGTLELVQHLAQRMRDAGKGRILFTGSIAGIAPAPYQAAYGGTKAFINSFAEALRQELADSGVSVTVLMPGATDTRFFKRAGMMDTKVAADQKADPADVARAGWTAVMAGDDKVVAGIGNKIQAAIARVVPAPLSAKRFGAMSKPGSDKASGSMMPLLLIGGGIVAGGLALAKFASARRKSRFERIADSIDAYKPMRAARRRFS